MKAEVRNLKSNLKSNIKALCTIPIKIIRDVTGVREAYVQTLLVFYR